MSMNGGGGRTWTFKPQREQIYSLPSLPLDNPSKMTGKRLSERPVNIPPAGYFHLHMDTGNSKAEKTPENNVNTVSVRTTSKLRVSYRPLMGLEYLESQGFRQGLSHAARIGFEPFSKAFKWCSVWDSNPTSPVMSRTLAPSELPEHSRNGGEYRDWTYETLSRLRFSKQLL